MSTYKFVARGENGLDKERISVDFTNVTRGKNGEYYVISKQREAHPVYKRVIPLMGTSCISDSRTMCVGTYCGPHAERVYNGQKIPTMITEEFFDLFAECGIDFFASTPDASTHPDVVWKFLQLCGDYGMGVFLTVSRLRGVEAAADMSEEKIYKELGEFANHGNVLGFELRDEPDVKMLKELKKTVDVVKNSAYGENHLLYYNAFPNYSTPKQLSGTDVGISYETYLREFVENLSAEYLSFDYYPFDKDGNASDGYFPNLSSVRNIADEYKIPFWAFVQCGEIFSIEFTKPQPDRPRFIWQVATELAYGAKGIQYFTLTGYADFLSQIVPYGERESLEGMFGVDNRINCWYYYAKEINAHIHKVDEVLVNAYHEGVIFHGDSPCPKSTGREVITSGTFRELVGVQGVDALIGCFDYKGKTALYVVNNTFETDGEITLTFDDEYGYDLVHGTEQTFATGKILRLAVPAGEGVLVLVK
jgi:hypothetical protein